jgi:predicted transcriptional regulator
MKQAANFRLDETVLNTIATLAKDLHTTKTDIIEKAVAQFAATTTHKRNALMQFAGALGKNDADSILSAIQKDKNSKDIDLHL